MHSLPDEFTAHAGSQHVQLPIVPIRADLAIALLVTVDRSVTELDRYGRDIAASVDGIDIDVVAAPATLGIPIAIETTRALGLGDFVVLQKTPKVHLADAISEPVTSLTTHKEQRLLLDRKREHVVRGRRVLLVDDVLSTGGSLSAAARLLEHAGAEIVAIRVVLTEGSAWRETLEHRLPLISALGQIPLFTRIDREWKEDWA